MEKLLLGIICLLLAAGLSSAYAQDVTVFIDGNEVEIPENKRLVLVPDHWLDEEIFRPSHRAMAVELLHPLSACPEPDSLSLGGFLPEHCPD